MTRRLTLGQPMLTLPDAIVAVLIPFAALFQNRTWRKAQVLLVGAVLSPGQRTVAAALRVMGLSGDGNYARYHHVLNRAAWSPLEVSQVLLRLLLQRLNHGAVHWCSASTKLWSGVDVPRRWELRSRPVVCVGFQIGTHPLGRSALGPTGHRHGIASDRDETGLMILQLRGLPNRSGDRGRPRLRRAGQIQCPLADHQTAPGCCYRQTPE